MTDTEILNALQALVDEHFKAGGLRFDFVMGKLHFVVPEPRPIHVPRAQAAIQSGDTPDLRYLIASALQPHLVRLVTNKLTRDA